MYLDYFPALADGRSFKRELTVDGLIPNAAGYAVMRPLAEAAIAEALKARAVSVRMCNGVIWAQCQHFLLRAGGPSPRPLGAPARCISTISRPWPTVAASSVS